MEKSEKHCSNCNTKYSVSWDEEKTDMNLGLVLSVDMK